MSCFPKINACTPVYADELNYMYDPYDIKASMLENGVNVAKLQYCYSLTDVDRDYMVVDVFTDSGGYNDSVCTADTTSTYCGSALTGYYYNYTKTTLTVPTATCYGHACTVSSGQPYTVCQAYGNYCVSNCFYGGCNIGGSSATLSLNVCESCCYNLVGYTKVMYCVCLGLAGTACCSTVGGCVCFINPVENLSLASTNCGGISCTCLWCIELNLVAGCTYCYCLNGGAVCCVTLSALNNMCIISTATYCSYNTRYIARSICSWGCLFNMCLCGLCNTKLQTVIVNYGDPVTTTYLDLESYGTGTITYNVYDAVTDCQIGTNLAPNTLNTLDDCVQCHYYEIIQCSDEVSCIKSYAILAGVY
jgi:hypothetical protein